MKFQDKILLVRLDLDISETNPEKFAEDLRFQFAFQTLQQLRSKFAKIIILAHRGRPNGRKIKSLSLKPIAIQLSKELQIQIPFINDYFNTRNKTVMSHLPKNSKIVMFENVRFYIQEEANDQRFAQYLASFGEIFLFDAFATAHRKHATTFGISNYLPTILGPAIKQELRKLKSFRKPRHPLLVILGGKKIEDKLALLKAYADIADSFFIGGEVALIIQKHLKYPKDKNLSRDAIQELLNFSDVNKKHIFLPIDYVVKTKNSKTVKIINANNVDASMTVGDIGPKSVQQCKNLINKAKTIIWNGPLGMYEYNCFKKSTLNIFKTIKKQGVQALIGGGNTVTALNNPPGNKYIYISSGGGALLHYLHTGTFPILEMINKNI